MQNLTLVILSLSAEFKTTSSIKNLQLIFYIVCIKILKKTKTSKDFQSDVELKLYRPHLAFQYHIQ